MSLPLEAPLEIGFDYTRSLGPVLSQFITALGSGRILGSRDSEGRVHAPPLEYDPVTHEPTGELVEVSSVGTVATWSWMPEPIEGQPLERPFAWALITLDGADTPLLHAVDAEKAEMRSGMRVRARFAGSPVGSIRDIECFEPGDVPAPAKESEAPAVEMTTTPIHLHYMHMASPEESRYLIGLKEGRLLAQRCPSCAKVYLPPRGACPTCGVPTAEEVELPPTGTVTTFCIVNVPFPGQRVKPPYVSAYVLIDGSDIGFMHLILGCEAHEVRMGMRVRAVWKPREQWVHGPQNIEYFEPTGEPDAAYETYASHL